MKNHQSSTISKRKQRKVFIISLFLQNEEHHHPLKIFPEQPPAKEKEEEKNCKKIQDTFLLSKWTKPQIIFQSSFQEKNGKKRKQIKANPLEEQQSRNGDFPWCTHIGQYRQTRRMFPVFWKYEEAQRIEYLAVCQSA